MEKSELDIKQVFEFIGYQFDLIDGKVKPTLEHRQTLSAKIKKNSPDPPTLSES